MKNILMVCLGNICRSPLAEGILRSKVNETEVFVDSAGTAGYHVGSLPDERSIEIARKNGLNITDQRCRKFVVEDFDKFDEIFVMDDSNYENVLFLARNEVDKSKVKLILNELYPKLNKNVPDPYYVGKQGFANVYEMLDKACEIIAKRL